METTIKLAGEGGEGVLRVTGDPELVRALMEIVVSNVRNHAASLSQKFVNQQYVDQFVVRKPCEGCPD